ncbi:MAG: hypothetical protein D6729_12315 [Deltaproteobacteria bacterium]|nr:MAG: hypothetical protein D6729_12315 [Deltaproteobacteria bacterium]
MDAVEMLDPAHRPECAFFTEASRVPPSRRLRHLAGARVLCHPLRPLEVVEVAEELLALRRQRPEPGQPRLAQVIPLAAAVEADHVVRFENPADFLAQYLDHIRFGALFVPTDAFAVVGVRQSVRLELPWAARADRCILLAGEVVHSASEAAGVAGIGLRLDPLTAVAAAALERAVVRARRWTSSGRALLALVVDCPDLADALPAAADNAQLEVRQVGSPVELAPLAAALRPELVVLGSEDPERVRTLRSLEATWDSVVVVVGPRGCEAAPLAAGADAYFRRPRELAALLRRVPGFLEEAYLRRVRVPFRAQARVEVHGRRYEFSVEDLALRGIRGATEAPLWEGATCRLVLDLAAEQAEVEARVVWLEAGPKGARVGLRFEDISAVDRARIHAAVYVAGRAATETLPQKMGEAGGRDVRIPWRGEASLHLAEGLTAVPTRDVSVGGLGLLREIALPAGTRVGLTVRLPDGTRARGRARVAWRGAGRTGLAFESLPLPDHKRLSAVVHAVLSPAEQRSTGA